MTNEDKQLICEYMGWTYHVTDDGKWWNCIGPKGGNHLLDLNDAGLVVEELQKRGEWEHDFMDFVAGSQKWNYHQCIAWLFNADNFFKTFVEWRGGRI